MSVFTIKPKAKGKRKGVSYDEFKRKINASNQEMVATGQEIGDIPAVVDPARREACQLNLELFCKTYFPEVFCLKFSKTHLRVMRQLQETAIKGGQYVLAMPRASGKTAIMSVAAIWTIFYGHRKFIVIVGSSASRAMELMDDIKSWVETNDLLNEDFPEACFPIRKLERITHRQRGQKCGGKPTRIDWAGNKLGFPMIDGSPSSGAIISASGMSGSDIRGQKALSPEGGIIRPDFVLIDDPQTRETAESPTQCAKREKIISGDILGMAGPGKTIAAFCTCTVIQQGDLADRILDRKLHPEWHGERYKMLVKEPVNTKLWEQYADVLKDDHRNDGDGSKATEFYRLNRAEMDEGSEVYWDERFEKGELSAIQNAMNLRIKSPAAFASEYQNEPEDNNVSEAMLTVDEIAGKLNSLNKGVVPIGVDHLTAFIDVQKEILFYCVCGWAEDFTGYVLDYGTWPEQRTTQINLRTITNTISSKKPDAGFEGAMYYAVDSLTSKLATTSYCTEHGQQVRIKLCLIDANWGESTDVIYQACQRSAHANILMPAHGTFVGATGKPFSEYTRHKGDRVGSHWRIPSMAKKRAIKHVLTDVNYWKTFVHSRLETQQGDRGSLTLYGRKKESHISFAEHCTAEYKVAVSAKGRTVCEWKIKPNNPDNHWFDCLVGCAVGASISGASLPGVQEGGSGYKKTKKKVSLRELQKQRGLSER